MPSVLPDAVVTNAATPVIINVLANDTGTNLTITSFSNPANGSLAFNGDKTFTYTPMAGFIGDDSFAYTVRDVQGTPANAEVTISVVPNTGATIATDDVVEVIAGAGVIIPVLANDMAAGGGALQIIAVSMPGHGAINVLPDQTIRYVPQAGFTGIDSFNYTVVDGQGSSASASVTVKVLTKNSPPTAGSDIFTVEAGQPTQLAVLANDSDPEGGPLQIVGFTMPSQGSLVFNPDRTFTYTPAAGYLGDDQFTYTIRDNRGASAVAAVTLVVAEVNATPVAHDDQVTTEAGAPVTIDVLANDTLPAGQQVNIVAVTLPYRGNLVFNPGKTITYTPNPGFVGTDDFTYTISNGKGGTAKAKVTIEVAAAVGATYENGYAYRRRIVLPAQHTEQLAIDDPVVLIAEQADWLRSSTAGGKIQKADGYDLRFEAIDGIKLDHEIESYDPITGRLLAWVRIPRWTVTEQVQLFLYYGNAQIEASEANSTGVWQGYLARWRLPDGSDATGNGRDLAADNVLSGELVGNAARFNGTGQLTLADTSWLDGLSSLTVQALIKPDGAMMGGTARILAPSGAAAPSPGITLGYLAETSDGIANVVYATIGTASGEAATFSLAERQSTNRQLIHTRWQSGSAPQIYLDGASLAASATQIASGDTVSSQAALEVGRDWIGLIDEVRIASRTLPSAWIEIEARNMLSPELSYGIGREEIADVINAPVVAVPIIAKGVRGKRIDIDVLSRIFATGDIELVDIVAITQPANGTVTALDRLVRYTSDNDFVGKEQFTYTIGNGDTQSTGLIVVEIFESISQGQDDSDLPLGQNLLLNSKFLGQIEADNWSTVFPDEGDLTFEESWDGHRKVRFASTGPAKPLIEQEVIVEKDKKYNFSVVCAAIADTSDANRVVLNHLPFSAGTLLSSRPTLGDLVAGGRAQYGFQATKTGPIRLRIGLESQQGTGGGDITLERPMLDQADSMRSYVATGLAPQPDEVSPLDWNYVPYNGLYEGQIRLLSSQQNSMRIRRGYYGWAFTVRRSGTIRVMQHQIASNHSSGETTKSTWGGSQSHPLPVSFPLGLRVFNATSNWQITGDALRDITWTYTNSKGGTDQEDGHGRVIFEHTLNLPVSEGQRLLFLVYNRHPDPDNHCPSVNMAANQEIRPAFGQNPPLAVTRFYGDDPTYIRADNRTGTLSRSGDRLYNFAIRYSDGVEEGSVAIDSNSNFSENVGGSNRIRQRFSSPYWRRTSLLALAILRIGTPSSGVTVRISGPDISAMQFVIPVDEINRRDVHEHSHRLYPMPGELILSPNTVYSVELSSVGSSDGAYIIHGQRHNRNMLANSTVSTGSFVTNGSIDPHKWSGLAEYSKSGGSSWSFLGYGSNADPSADWPIAFYIGRKMAMTPETLPA